MGHILQILQFIRKNYETHEVQAQWGPEHWKYFVEGKAQIVPTDKNLSVRNTAQNRQQKKKSEAAPEIGMELALE